MPGLTGEGEEPGGLGGGPVGGGLEHPVDVALAGPAEAGPRGVQPGETPLVEQDRVVLCLGPEVTNTLYNTPLTCQKMKGYKLQLGCGVGRVWCLSSCLLLVRRHRHSSQPSARKFSSSGSTP